MVGRTSAPPPRKRPAAPRRGAAPAPPPPARVRLAVAAWTAVLGLAALVLLLARGADDAPVPPGTPVPVAPRGYNDAYYESENLRFKRPVPAAPAKSEDAEEPEEESP